MPQKQPKPPDDPWDVQKIEAKAPDDKSVKAARKVLKKGGIRKVEPRADGQGWWAVCKGLTDTYEVSVKRGPRGGLESRCNCFSSKRPCKHALALLFYLAEHPEARPEAAAPAAKASVDFESLLRTAFAAPEDDTARLVLADYLEENDQSDRAALIRVQCEISRLADTDAEWKEAIAREAKLLAAVKKQLGKFPNGYQGEFVRGFLRFTDMGAGADAIPARFLRMFADGWVEAIQTTYVMKAWIPLFRWVGTVDLTSAYLNDGDLATMVGWLQSGHPETRTRAVRMTPANAERYRALGGQGAVS
jgi:uncharacterized protein (TIGR02996 family)